MFRASMVTTPPRTDERERVRDFKSGDIAHDRERKHQRERRHR